MRCTLAHGVRKGETVGKGGFPMEMLLMGACLSVFGLAVACLAFGTATREVEESVAAAPAVQKGVAKAASVPARFFVRPVPVAARTAVPIEALLLQIEKHVRLEKAAA